MKEREAALEQRKRAARRVVVGTAFGDQLYAEYMADETLTYRSLATRHKLAVGTVMRAIEASAKKPSNGSHSSSSASSAASTVGARRTRTS